MFEFLEAYDRQVTIMGISMNLLWLLGVGCSLVACCCSSLGFVLQKLSYNRGEAKLPLHKRVTWITGISVVIVGAGVFDSIAFSYAPMSLLAPLAGVTIFFNLLFSDRILHEKISLWEVGAACLIITGTTLSTLYGDHESPTYKQEDIMNLIYGSRTTWIWALVVTIALILSGITVILTHEGQQKKAGRKWEVELSLVYGFYSGQMGCIAGICLKCFVSLVRASIDTGDSEMNKAWTWMFLGSFTMCALTQLIVINIGLSMYDYAFFSMVYQTFFILCGVIGGGIFFQEIQTFSTMRWWVFCTGVTITVMGLGVLGFGEEKHQDEKRESQNGTEGKPLLEED